MTCKLLLCCYCSGIFVDAIQEPAYGPESWVTCTCKSSTLGQRFQPLKVPIGQREGFAKRMCTS